MNLEICCRLRNNKSFNYIKKDDIYYLDCKHKNKNYEFMFNNLWFDNDDKKIFECIYPNIQTEKISYVMAFGYSGSGKTYTLLNLLRNILNSFLMNKIDFKINGYQIYNENIYDLFDNNKKIKYFMGNNLVVKNLKFINSNNINNIIDQIIKNRSTSDNNINNESSRSHAVFSIYFQNKKCTIVDMAGLEAGNVNKNSKIFKEANNINLNMLALKECIRSFNSKNKFIPYRRSILTLLLKDMFIFKNKIYFICNINCSNNFNYQLDCLKYGTSLCKSKDKKPFYYDKLLLEYSIYIQNNLITFTEEHDLWKEIKNRDFNKIQNIKKLLKNQKNNLLEFEKKIDKILPTIYNS